MIRISGRALSVQHGLTALSGIVAALAVLLAVSAVLVGLQSAPTVTAAQARDRTLEWVLGAATAAGVTVSPAAADDAQAGCRWLGLDLLPASGQVRPGLLFTVPLPVGADPAGILDAVARAVTGAGGSVGARGPSSLDAVDKDGYHLSVRTDGELVLAGEGPCVWPGGTREPGP